MKTKQITLVNEALWSKLDRKNKIKLAQVLISCLSKEKQRLWSRLLTDESFDVFESLFKDTFTGLI
jgi:hypothetical protein